jgi:hypothetical protein
MQRVKCVEENMVTMTITMMMMTTRVRSSSAFSAFGPAIIHCQLYFNIDNNAAYDYDYIHAAIYFYYFYLCSYIEINK